MIKTTRTTTFLITILCFVALILASSTSLVSADRLGRRAPWNNNNQQSGQTGKTEATPGAQPWMVALVDRSTSNAHDGQFCGASLIHRQWVLTAAHCLEGTSANQIDVVIGRHQLSSNTGERIQVSQVIVHPQYYDDHDIALLRLSKPASKGALIMTITDVTDHLDVANVQARVTGWGVLSEDGEDSPDKLHGVNVPIVDDNVCKSAYNPGDIGRYELCAGTLNGGADSCYGDSGGPLVVPNANKTGWLQAGVVSWGDGCGLSYGVYTRVSEYQEWINHHLYGSAQPAPLPEDGGRPAEDNGGGEDEEGSWDEGDWDEGDWDSDSDSAENNTQFPSSLPLGFELIASQNNGDEAYASYENDAYEWVDITSYNDGYTNLNEYLEEIDAPTSGKDIIYVNGVKLFIEQIEGGLGATMVIDGDLIFIDTSMGLSQLRTIVYSFLTA
ncbi:MAG: S1 family serine peptidase [Candidatus Promineifilaceae bacterium]